MIQWLNHAMSQSFNDLMKLTLTPRVKICCISSVAEAGLAVECGASALGLVSHMPSGPGIISDEQIAEIAATVPPAIGTFLLTSRQDVSDIIAQQHLCRTNTDRKSTRLNS